MTIPQKAEWLLNEYGIMTFDPENAKSRSTAEKPFWFENFLPYGRARMVDPLIVVNRATLEVITDEEANLLYNLGRTLILEAGFNPFWTMEMLAKKPFRLETTTLTLLFWKTEGWHYTYINKHDVISDVCTADSLEELIGEMLERRNGYRIIRSVILPFVVRDGEKWEEKDFDLSVSQARVFGFRSITDFAHHMVVENGPHRDILFHNFLVNYYRATKHWRMSKKAQLVILENIAYCHSLNDEKEQNEGDAIVATFKWTNKDPEYFNKAMHSSGLINDDNRLVRLWKELFKLWSKKQIVFQSVRSD